MNSVLIVVIAVLTLGLMTLMYHHLGVSPQVMAVQLVLGIVSEIVLMVGICSLRTPS